MLTDERLARRTKSMVELLLREQGVGADDLVDDHVYLAVWVAAATVVGAAIQAESSERIAARSEPLYGGRLT